MVSFLENSEIQVLEGAQSSIFVRSKSEKAQPGNICLSAMIESDCQNFVLITIRKGSSYKHP